MTSTTLFTLALQASQEPQPELAQAGQSTRAPDLPALEEVQATLESLPPKAYSAGHTHARHGSGWLASPAQPV